MSQIKSIRNSLVQSVLCSTSLGVLSTIAIAQSALAKPTSVPVVQLSNGLLMPVSTTIQSPAGGNGSASSSSNSSAFANSQGAGASSTATVITPAGTQTSQQTVFTPGSTSASASATAATTSSGGVITNATAVSPASGGGGSPVLSPIIVIPNGPTVTVNSPSPLSTSITFSTASSSVIPSNRGLTSGTPLPVIALGAISATTLPSSTTFIPSFSQSRSHPNIDFSIAASVSHTRSYRMVGLPSRVFPGLGVRYVPVK